MKKIIMYMSLMLVSLFFINGCTTEPPPPAPETTKWNALPFNTLIGAKFTTDDYLHNYYFNMNKSGLFSFDFSSSIQMSGVLKDSNGVIVTSFSSSFKQPLKIGKYFIDWSVKYGNVPNGSATIPFSISIDSVDTVEYNNGYTNASPLGLNQYVKSKIIPESDVDYFAFDIDKSKICKIKIKNISSNLKLDVSVYNSELVSKYSETYSLNQDSIVIGLSFAPGRYYLRVNSWLNSYSSNNPMDIVVEDYKLDSTESNNTIESAFNVALNTTIAANIWPEGDVDYYKISVTDTSIVKVKVDSVSTKINLRCSIYDSEGVSISTLNEVGNCTLKPKKAGVYYFKFYDYYGYYFSEKLHRLTIIQ